MHDTAAWFAHANTINSTAAVGGDCTVRTGSPPNINPDALLDADAGSVNLTTGTYTCQKWVNGVKVAELSWNGSTTLTIQGVIVVDGNLSTTDTLATYVGIGGDLRERELLAQLLERQALRDRELQLHLLGPQYRDARHRRQLDQPQRLEQRLPGRPLLPDDGSVNLGGSNNILHGPIICGGFNFINSSNTEFKPMPPITQLPLGVPLDYNVHVAPGTPAYGG